MPADSAMLAAVRETVVGLPDKGSTTLSPPPAPRRSTSDQSHAATTQAFHGSSQSTTSGAPTGRSGGGQSQVPHPRLGPTTAGSSRDPFSDRASRPSRGGGGNTSASSGGGAKKGSRHADAIDKLDPSNFWGGMLHHESAYDAAAPSRNLKTSSRAAPMGAFDGSSSSAAPPPTTASRRGLSALASRTLDKMGSIKFADDTKGSPGAGAGGPHSAPTYGAEGAESYFDVLPTVPASGNGDSGSDDRTPPGGSSGGGGGGAMSRGLKLIRSRSRDRKNSGGASGEGSGGERRGSRGQDVPLPDEDDYLNARAKEKKNALANAWGVADPEPFEDFSVMAAATGPRGDTGLASASSSIWNGHERHAQAQPSPPPPLPARSAAGADRKYSLTESYAAADEDGGAVEEVLSPGDVNGGSYGSSPAAAGGGATVKRSRSLMQRIRNMRDSPNVPIVQEVKPSSPGAGSAPLSGSLPTSASYSTFGSHQQHQQLPRRGFFGRQMSSQSDQSAPSSAGPSPTSDHSFHSDQQHQRQQQQEQHGRTRSRSDLMSSSVSHGSIATLGPVLAPSAGSTATRDKSLPRVPDATDISHRSGSAASGTNEDEDASDPFADAPEPPAMPARRPSDRSLHASAPSYSHAQQHRQQHRSTPSTASTTSTRPIGRTRSPVPPPAPIDLPGQDQSNLYPQRFADGGSGSGGAYGSGSSGAGGGSGGGASGLGRKGSLMKRVLGRG